MENKRKIYHYLHNSASGCVKGEWRNGKFCFALPPTPAFQKTTLNADSLEKYELAIDPRDQRTLVVFDGHIPWGGLCKRGNILKLDTFGDLHVPVVNVRLPRPEEERPLWHIFDNDKNQATLRIHRYFLLLPKRVSCVRKYDHRSLRPIHTFIEVNQKGVTWRTSSY